MLLEKRAIAELESVPGLRLEFRPGACQPTARGIVGEFVKQKFDLDWEPPHYRIVLPRDFPSNRVRLLKRVRGLDCLVAGESFDDDALWGIAGHSRLRELILPGSRVTDAGLAALTSPELDTLFLDDTSISDAGLVYVARLSGLRHLALDRTQVTDAGMAFLAGLELVELSLKGTRVGDAGVAQLESTRSLERVWLSGSRISDDAVTSLSRLPNLNWLEINNTAVTDEGVARLSPGTCGTWLSLISTNVTSTGLASLRVQPEILNVSDSAVRYGPELMGWMRSGTSTVVLVMADCELHPEELEELRSIGTVYVADVHLHTGDNVCWDN
jgi:hypothetical protein